MDVALGNCFAFFIYYTCLTLSCSAGLVWFMGCHSVCLIELDQHRGERAIGGRGSGVLWDAYYIYTMTIKMTVPWYHTSI